jgi:hypothetical protein
VLHLRDTPTLGVYCPTFTPFGVTPDSRTTSRRPSGYLAGIRTWDPFPWAETDRPAIVVPPGAPPWANRVSGSRGLGHPPHPHLTLASDQPARTRTACSDCTPAGAHPHHLAPTVRAPSLQPTGAQGDTGTIEAGRNVSYRKLAPCPWSGPGPRPLVLAGARRRRRRDSKRPAIPPPLPSPPGPRPPPPLPPGRLDHRHHAK